MLDPGGELVAPQSSPTNSSISSSDLDTQSTGSFFHDRSTTLGTLMGLTFRATPQNTDSPSATATAVETSRRAVKSKRNTNPNAADFVVAKRRRRWWQFCSDGDSRSASLGEFLEVERRFGDAAFYDTAAELEGLVVDSPQQRNSGRALFADGRILPPSVVGERSSTAGSLCSRFPVSLTGICSSGGG
ncbi:uncharacterized protein At3g17950 [Lathyrus oleraceus]|uniref:Uncharacterized protein n=2 Tax=Pisum sativum TaxID=3888 RepID=A0A9D4VEY7_PEA|nr:uncharacterized protein At3g17950 [Pisum sativum]KAI5382452.1 hypothetical protein KIW84_070034 [Pisum sativum]